MISSVFISLILASIILCEVGILLLRASRERFWYDEVFTFRVAGIRPFSLLWKALQEGVDAMPPGYYALASLITKLPGNPHVTLRLPSILGYILTLLGTYWFVQHGLPDVVALTAVILLALTPFRKYALQARSYSLVVGFLALAAVFWQRIGDAWFMTPLLALFLILATSCHYLATAAISVFGFAELTWSLLFGQVRPGVWIACLVATCPFFIGLPHLLRFRNNFGKGFFSRPLWSMVLETYGEYLGFDDKLTLVLVLSFSVVIYRRQPDLPDIILVSGFLLYPALLVVLTKLLGSGYTPRYGWPVIFGLIISLTYLCRPIWFASSSVYFFGACLLAFVFQTIQDLRLLPNSQTCMVDWRWTTLAELSRDKPGIPVVIAGGLAYIEAFQYAPPDLRDRLTRIIDPDTAIRLLGWDTADRGTAVLARYVPLRVEDPVSFRSAHPTFILHSGGAGDWLTPYLLEQRYQLNLLARDNDSSWSIYFVEAPS